MCEVEIYTDQQKRSKKDVEEENERQFKEACRPRLVKLVHFLSQRNFFKPEDYYRYRFRVLGFRSMLSYRVTVIDLEGAVLGFPIASAQPINEKLS